jgi:phosphoserine aminotransferase
MFEEAAKKWIDDMLREGKLQEVGEGALKKLAADYADRLEKIFHEEVSKQLAVWGKAEEFERILLYDGQYVNKYLNQTIPGYQGFKTDIFNNAKKIIMGD